MHMGARGLAGGQGGKGGGLEENEEGWKEQRQEAAAPAGEKHVQLSPVLMARPQPKGGVWSDTTCPGGAVQQGEGKWSSSRWGFARKTFLYLQTRACARGSGCGSGHSLGEGVRETWGRMGGPIGGEECGCWLAV